MDHGKILLAGAVSSQPSTFSKISKSIPVVQNLKNSVLPSEAGRRFTNKSASSRKLPYFFFGTAFFAVLFLATAFLAAGFAAFASALGASTACFLGFTSFFGNSGAANFCPLNAISVIRTEENGWRCPAIFLYCFFFLYWNT